MWGVWIFSYMTNISHPLKVSIPTNPSVSQTMKVDNFVSKRLQNYISKFLLQLGPPKRSILATPLLALEHVQTYKLPSDESFSNALVDQTLDVETTFGHDDISLLHTLSEQRSYCDKSQQVPYGSSCCIDKFEIDFLLAWWC